MGYLEFVMLKRSAWVHEMGCKSFWGSMYFQAAKDLFEARKVIVFAQAVCQLVSPWGQPLRRPFRPQSKLFANSPERNGRDPGRL